MYNKYSYKHNCLATIDAETIVESVITKMKYTCDNPYCKHRIAPTGRIYGDQKQYNRQRKSKSRSAGKMNRGRQSCLCFNRLADNPEQQQYQQNSYVNKRSPYNNHQHCFSRFCNSYTHPAGNYQREQQRGRWINNSLHNGYTMEKILYESQNPRARIQSGQFAKNYDTQYQIAQSRIMNTRAPSPQRRSKIATLVRRDRERSK